MYGEDVWCEHAFCRGGVSVDLIRDGHVVGGFDTSAACGLYVDRREQTDKARKREKLIALCASVLYGSSVSVKHEHENKHEHEHVHKHEQTDKANERIDCFVCFCSE
jgi:hypothetical protein